VEAGPFLVTVKGTVFTVSWDSASERFELRLRHGRVVVSGPVVGEGVALRAGQRLAINLPRGETVINEEPPESPTGPSFGSTPPSHEPVARAQTDTAAPASRAAAGSGPAVRPLAARGASRRWAAELANGQWDRILAEVDREGADATLASAPSEDLFAIADAARYRRRADLARAALLAQRRRFPRSARSLDAMFLLGRVEELRQHGAGQAIEMYDQYLAVAPTGAYAAEALGRKMILMNETGGPAKARPIAEEYLLRFPSGSYAGSARALTRVP
jgi:TolA-binding protein